MKPAPITTPFAAAVLAGGQSTRFGTDKAFARWKGRRLLDRQLDLLRALSPAQLFVSGRADVDYGVAGATVVLDAVPDQGPLGGLAAVLAAAATPHLLVLAVDLPAMTDALLQSLVAQRTPGVGVVPRTPGGWEPLAAVYPRELLALVHRHLRQRKLALQQLVDAGVAGGLLIAAPVPAGALGLFQNLNSPPDLAPPPRNDSPRRP